MFQFEIAHRLRGENNVVESSECDVGDDYDDNFDYGEARNET